MSRSESAGSPSAAPPSDFSPYVAAETELPEFTWSAVLAGTLLGIVFGASSLYLVLKVGITVSASIPVAVLSITLFRVFSQLFGIRRATVLENNIVQTAGSAGESIAFGVGVTMPAVMLLGFDLSIGRVMAVAVLGGLLGILMMIPLRRALIVRLHGKPGEPGKLVYPEGTACAEVLLSGERGETSGKVVFVGFGLAFVHKFLSEGMQALVVTVSWPLTFFNRAAVLAGDMASELLGVGYIIGARTGSVMMAGAVIGNLVIIPLISIGGGEALAELSHDALRKRFLINIGAGCVAAAGIVSMFRTLPLILRSLGAGLGNLRRGAAAGRQEGSLRTERDLSLRTVAAGSIGLLVLLALFLAQEVHWVGAWLGAALVLTFGFLFVTVSSRLTGEIGSTSNPISGMTVATLSLTCLIFLLLGMTSPAEQVLALSIGGVVCIAASNGGTTSQDLKTGFLVGATPRAQQVAILIGALTSALVIGGTLLLFNAAGTVYVSRDLPRLNLRDRLAEFTETETYQEKTYRVWRPVRDEQPPADEAVIRTGKYLVDEQGEIRYLVDPAITGQYSRRDDGSEVKLKFEAPKTQVMYQVISGVLRRELDWGLAIAGAMIVLMLELCGVSSLPFAVGVYVPIQYSVPIFLGGMVRHAVNSLGRWKARSPAADEVAAIAETETSPGVLLASGYIAGGTLSGVTTAFLEFAPGWKAAVLDFSQANLPASWRSGPAAAAWIFAALMLILLVVGGGKLSRGKTNSSA